MQSFLAVVRYAMLAAVIADVSRHLGLPLSFAQAFCLVALVIALHMETVDPSTLWKRVEATNAMPSKDSVILGLARIFGVVIWWAVCRIVVGVQ